MELVSVTPITLSNADNLNPISLCELNTKFTYKCCADWSKSNLISVVTPDGIYILKPQLNNQDGPFEIELIRNPVNKFKHKVLEDKIPTFDTNWHKLSHDQYMEAFLDPALNTHIESLSLNLYPRQYKFAKWSPILDIYPKQCLLAVITSDYQLLVFKKTLDSWLIQFDLSNEFDRLWAQLNNNKTNIDCSNIKKEKPKPRKSSSRKTTTTTSNHHDLTNNNDDTTNDESASLSFEEIRKRLHSLSFCNVCWKQTTNNDLLLLATTIPGDIVIWQFKWDKNILIQQTEPILEVKVILQTNLFMINAMHLFEDLLIVSSQDGQVVLYDLTVNFQEISGLKLSPELKKQKQQVENNLKTLSLISLPPTATLWHTDNIEVADFFIQPISNESFRIVIAKATNICWCLIYYTKMNGNEPAKLAISDSYSAIDGKDPEISLHQTPATWLKPAGSRKAVFIADDGSFFQLEFADNQQDSIPEFNAIRTGKVDLTRLVPKGLCTSPNGNLITMISYISLMYEPDKIVCPTKIVLLPINNNDKNFINECLEKLLDEIWLTNNNINSPMDVCDLIDFMRSIFPIFTVEQSSEMYKIFSDSITKTGIPRNKFQLTKLKIIAFLLKKLFEFQNGSKMVIDSTSNNSISLDLTTQTYDIILLYNINEILEKVLSNIPKSILSEKRNVKGGDIDDNINFETIQLISLNNYYEWLNKCVDRGEILEKFKDKIELIIKKYAKDMPKELCPICQSKIPFISPKYGICNNGHRFDRCARSLIILKLEESNEFVCEHCKRHYMTTLIWPFENLWLCSHCQ